MGIFDKLRRTKRRPNADDAPRSIVLLRSAPWTGGEAEMRAAFDAAFDGMQCELRYEPCPTTEEGIEPLCPIDTPYGGVAVLHVHRPFFDDLEAGREYAARHDPAVAAGIETNTHSLDLLIAAEQPHATPQSELAILARLAAELFDDQTTVIAIPNFRQSMTSAPGLLMGPANESIRDWLRALPFDARR